MIPCMGMGENKCFHLFSQPPGAVHGRTCDGQCIDFNENELQRNPSAIISLLLFTSFSSEAEGEKETYIIIDNVHIQGTHNA